MKPLNLKKVQRDPIEFVVTRDTAALDRIMRHLNVTDLLNCRLVSRFWNTGASFVLRRRSTMIKNLSEGHDLRELEECMKQSWDFPYGGLKLNSSWKCNTGGALEFFTKYGARFTRLGIDTSWLMMKIHLFFLSVFTERLPRLSILEIDHLSREFPLDVTSLMTSPMAPGIRLGLLEILRISSPCSERQENVLLLSLTAASSLSLQIECLDASPVLLGILQRAGKVGAVSFIKILEVEEDEEENQLQQMQMDQLLSIESPSLTKLEFNAGGCLSSAGLRTILSSSQHTLKELHLAGESIFLDSWCSIETVFTKLTKLSFSLDMDDDPVEYLLFGSSVGIKFPALKQVKLEMTYDRANGAVLPSLSSGVFIVPSVTSLEIDGYVDEDGLHERAQMTSWRGWIPPGHKS